MRGEVPPMLASVRDDVELFLNDVPVALRPGVRLMVRKVAGVAWQQGYWQAYRELTTDRGEAERERTVEAERVEQVRVTAARVTAAAVKDALEVAALRAQVDQDLAVSLAMARATAGDVNSADAIAVGVVLAGGDQT